MERLCYLLDGVASARMSVGALHGAGFPDSSIRVLARQDIPLGDLPAAHIKATDAINSMLVPLQEAIQAGGVVLMVDVHKTSEQQIEDLLRNQIRGGELVGIERRASILSQ